MGKAKYKRLTDLYVVGVEAVLADDMVIWVQALNPYERDEAVHDAQVARSRIVMAMREAGEERVKVEARLQEFGVDVISDEMAGVKSTEKLSDYADEIRQDPDWRERMEILERTDGDNSAKPLEPVETDLLEKINREYIEEILKREETEREYLTRSYQRMERPELLDAYMDMYLDKRGAEVANSEYLLTEMWYGARVCEGVRDDDGVWDHSKCAEHTERIWDSKGEVRSLPEGIQTVLRDSIRTLEMRPRDAKNSDRQGSSSDSSPLPSEPAESTPSTPTETPSDALGTSPSPSVTH